jgi:hypothetical protein
MRRTQEAPMAMVLYGHPFSSYTQKVLMALFPLGAPDRD